METTQDVWYNQANEFDTFEYEGKVYPIKWYGGLLFATEDLADVMIGEDGYGKDDRAIGMDERISSYLFEEDFNGKTGKELYEFDLNL